MKRVITYGTFDLLHQGHINILKRAKALGDYLVVGVTREEYDLSRGKLNVKQSLIERIENVKSTGLADLIIVEEYTGQKVRDIKKYNIDTFVIGSDWYGKFDYLKDFCEVVYLERTKGISSTDLRNNANKILKLGVVGNGRIAKRFIKESKYVSGIDVDYVYGRNEENLKSFTEQFNLNSYYTNYDEFLSKGFEYIINDYIKRNCFLEKDLNVQVLNSVKSGYAKGINNNGELILQTEDNKDLILNIGDIL